MPLNLTLDHKLIELARRLGGHKTKQEAVTAALVEYIAQRKRLEIISLLGSLEMDPEYDYKTQRLRKQ
jgi:putative antitoxin of VapBC-like toxin-antitoxin system